MSPGEATVLLCATTGLLFILPMLPAIDELRRKTDAEPLNVVQQYAGEIAHFAHGFRDSVQRLAPVIAGCAATRSNTMAALRGGDSCIAIGNPNDSSLPEQLAVPNCTTVVIAAVNMELPARTVFVKEIYAAGALKGGEESTYRAIYGDADVALGRASRVMRWAHAAGSLRAGRDCDLYGRISSDGEIVMDAGCAFQRVHAQRIEIGEARAADPSQRGLETPGGAVEARRVVRGNLEIRPGEVVRGDVVARGRVRVGAGAILLGSLKSGKGLVLEDDVQARGSVVSGEGMRIGAGCRIHGPVIAEREMWIESDTHCGEADALTSVCALKIRVREGVVIFGTLWAREAGETAGRA